MRICFFLGGFTTNGGIGRVTSMLANRLSEDCKYNIFTLSYSKTNLPTLFNISKDVVQCFLNDRNISMTSLLLRGGEMKLRRFLVENDIDILIACGALFFPLSVRACKGVKTKCICWEHSNPRGNTDHKMQNLARKYGVHRSELNVVLTRSALKIFKEEYKALKTIQIYNPIDNDVCSNTTKYSENANRIVSVGRLTYQKNFERAIEIAERVLIDHKNWTWDIYGDGVLRESLEDKITRKGLSNRINLMGQVSDIYDRYQDYSIMAMTSRYEGFPMTLLEGVGKGLPIISFDIPTGPNEIIIHGENGFLISNDDTSSYIQHLNLLMTDANLRKRMSEKNREICNHFSESEVLQEWKEALEML